MSALWVLLDAAGKSCGASAVHADPLYGQWDSPRRAIEDALNRKHINNETYYDLLEGTENAPADNWGDIMTPIALPHGYRLARIEVTA